MFQSNVATAGWAPHRMLFLAVTIALVASGCASQQFVNRRVDPLGQRVGAVESAARKQSDEIEELSNHASRADERAVNAADRADAAGQAAERAEHEARRAGRSAAEAITEAGAALDGLDRLEERMDGINEYELVSQQTLEFGFESSELTDDAKEKLDETAMTLLLGAPYQMEVLGYTDTTGNPAYNLTLSERRAQAVVRYLTGELGVPLHRIHTIGMGSQTPAADNQTLAGRQKNRRVEVLVYVADRETVTALRW